MDKKPAAIILELGGMGPKESEEGPGEKEMLAEEVMAALKEGDAESFAMALENFISYCGMAEEE